MLQSSTPTKPVQRPALKEVWYVNLAGTKGGEQEDSRPAVVVSRSGVGRQHNVVVIIPLTSKGVEGKRKWLGVRVIQPRDGNGLSKPSAVLGFQVRALDVQRFIKLMGTLDDNEWSSVQMALGDVFPPIVGPHR